MEFNKSVLSYLRSVVNEIKDQEQMGEIRLPDGSPDIGRILCTWGQVIIRGKEWRGNGVTVSGGIQAKVLYEPDGDDPLQCLETWIPFQTKWEFGNNEKDGFIRVRPCLLGIDSRTASARKAIVIARIGIGGKAMVSDSLEIPAAPDLPSDVQLLKSTYPMLMPVEAGEKAFSLEEHIPLPEGKPVPVQIISYTVRPCLSETKLMGDKLVFRGTAKMHIVYMDTDNRLHCWDHDMQFSQYTQLDREYDDTAEVGFEFAITGLEFESDDSGAYVCRVGVAAQYVIMCRMVSEIVEDVFSPVRKISYTTVDVDMPSVLDQQEMMIEAQCQFSTTLSDVVDVAMYAGVPGSYTEDGEDFADLGGTFQILGYDVTGTVTAQCGKWEKAFPLMSDCNTKTEMHFLSHEELEYQLNGDTVSLQGRIPLECTTVSRRPMTMISSVELGDPALQNPERPSLILRKAGDDSLWKIAKDSGSSVSSIMKANGLTGEPDPEQMILIPVT